jgi:hypothetical protein
VSPLARQILGLENAVDAISDAEKPSPSAFPNAPFNPLTSEVFCVGS